MALHRDSNLSRHHLTLMNWLEDMEDVNKPTQGALVLALGSAT
jgi:hypothetical protein